MVATAPPQDADFNAVGCDRHWLVLDGGWPGGPAGCDGPSCGQNMAVTHWFSRAGPDGWITIASSLTAVRRRFQHRSVTVTRSGQVGCPG